MRIFLSRVEIMDKNETEKSQDEKKDADELHFELLKGEGYEADNIDDLMDQLDGKKKLKPIKL